MPRQTSSPVIDSDSHISLDPAVWERYLDPEFRYHPGRPRFTKENGLTYFEFGRLCFPRRGVPITYTTPSGMGPGPRGGLDPHFRMADYMEPEGIDRGLLFPGRLAFVAYCGNRELGSAVARAYNDWLAAFCRPYPDRLFGIGVLNAADPPAAIAEMRRCVFELGFPAVFLTPHFVGRTAAESYSAHDEWYYPIYEAAAAIGVPICFHAFARPHVPGYDQHWPSVNFFANDVLGFPFEGMLTFASLVAGGVCEQFPTLKLGIFEASLGWVPMVLDRMHERLELFPGLAQAYAPLLKLRPEEYLQRQIWFGFEPEDAFVPQFIAATGAANRVLFSGDYPHLDYVHGQAVRSLLDRDDLTETQKRQALCDNALEFFRWQDTAIGRQAAIATA